MSFQESLPAEYGRIFAFDNFRRTQKHVLAKAQEMEQGNVDECITAGSYLRLHIKEVPKLVASKLSNLTKTTPVISCGLFQHESKISVLHFRSPFLFCFFLSVAALCLLFASDFFYVIKKMLF